MLINLNFKWGEKIIFFFFFLNFRIFEYPEFNIAVRYAGILNQMYNLAFYCPILPQATIWVIISLIL
jgi:hypothetical protein